MSESRIAIVIDANGQAAIAEFDAVTGAMKRTMGNTDLLNAKAKSLGDGPDAAGKKWQDFGGLVGKAITSILGGLTAMIGLQINALDETGKLAQKLGVSSEFMSEMGYAAKASGADIKILSNGLFSLSKVTSDAANGGKKQQALFESIGLSALDAQGKVKSLEQLLPQIADKFAGLKDGPQKAALAMKLFGTAGKELIPLLNEGAAGTEKLREEAKRLGLSMSDEATAGAAQLKDQFDKLTAISTGLFTQLAVDLLPVLNVLAGLLVDQADASAGAAKETSILTRVVQVLSSAALIGVAAWESLLNIIFATADTIGTVVKTALNNISAGIESAKKQLSLLSEGKFTEAFNQPLKLYDEIEKNAESARIKIDAYWKSAGDGIDDAVLKASDAIEKINNPPGLDGGGKVSEALGEVETGLEDVRKAAAEAQKELLKQQAEQLKWADNVAQLQAQLSGPLAEAEYKHAKAIAEATAALKKKYITEADYQKLAAKGGYLDQQLAKTRKQLADDVLRNERAALAPSEKALKNVREELRLRGLVGTAREDEIALMRDQETVADLLLQLEEDKLSLSEQAYEQARKNIDLLEEELAKKRELDKIDRARSGGLFDLLDSAGAESQKEGGKNFGKGFWESLKGIFKPTGEGGSYSVGDIQGITSFIGTAVGELSNLRDIYRNSDGNGTGSVLRSISQRLANVPGPVGIIASIANLVDQVFGGKLFGTDFQRVGGSQNLNFGTGGFSGSNTTVDVRQRSFFRGRQWRSTTTPIDSQQQAQFNDYFEQVSLSVRSAARLLGANLPDLVSGSFVAAYDASGNLTNAFSTVLGRAYVESAEAFTQRVQAENMLAVLAGVLPTAQLNAIADQWRSDAGVLSEGAALLLQYAAELEQGVALIDGPDGLARMVEIVEELQGAGETLSQTYQRLTQTAREYGAVVAQAEGELLLQGASAFARTIIQIRQEEIQRTQALQAQARALGGLAAREQDLARVREAARIKIEAAARAYELELLDVVADLYGTPLEQIEAQIAALTGSADDAAGKLQNFMRSLLLSQELSPLTDREQIDVARSSLIAATSAKDTDGFIEAAQAFLEISRRLNASGSDYTGDFDLVNSLASQFGLGTNGATGDLDALIAQRDAILARERQAERLGQAQDVAQGIADLADVRGLSFNDVASSLGVDLGALATDLGLTGTSINDYLQSLQVDTADLAQILIGLPDQFARALFDVLAATNLSLTPNVPVIGPVVTPGTGNPPIGGGGAPNPGTGPDFGGIIGAVNFVVQQLDQIQKNTAAAATAAQSQANSAMFGPLIGSANLVA